MIPAFAAEDIGNKILPNEYPHSDKVLPLTVTDYRNQYVILYKLYILYWCKW